MPSETYHGESDGTPFWYYGRRMIYATKPGNITRFKRKKDESLHQSRRIAVLKCGGELWYLPEDPFFAYHARPADEVDYNPAFDEDRYAVVCFKNPPVDSEDCGCPCWEKVRSFFPVGETNVAVCSDLDAADLNPCTHDCYAVVSGIGKGDGRFGKIAEWVENVSPVRIDEVSRECEKCEKCRNAGEGAAYGIYEKLIMQPYYGAEKHGVIIPYITKLFRKTLKAFRRNKK